jgi:DNA-binding CsgD family transcriptional regulator/predicted membrane protein
MIQFPRLTRREWEVVNLLLQGDSNKRIASSLDISVRTVEFHLKNIYAKFQVNSRIELILMLVNTPGLANPEKPGCSTVAERGKIADNRDRLNLRINWVTPFRDYVSFVDKEIEMNNILKSHIFVGTSTALVTGFVWMMALIRFSTLSFNEIKIWVVPLLLVWAIIGLFVGVVGKRNGKTMSRVLFSALLGTGAAPFAIVPLMLLVVLPIGKLAERFGMIDPATMSNNVATTLAMLAMTAIWLFVGVGIGIILLFLKFKKHAVVANQVRVSENG